MLFDIILGILFFIEDIKGIFREFYLDHTYGCKLVIGFLVGFIFAVIFHH